MTAKSERIIIYTDGASLGNPGPGGYGIVMTMEHSPYRKQFSEGFRKTTNNRMELMAVVEALKKIKKDHQDVVVVTDSRYVSDAINKGWLENWIRRDFKKVKNPDLWKELARLLQNHKVEFIWIKGHNGHPENELCDKLAVKAAKLPPEKQRIDEFYEKGENPPSLF